MVRPNVVLSFAWILSLAFAAPRPATAQGALEPGWPLDNALPPSPATCAWEARTGDEGTALLAYELGRRLAGEREYAGAAAAIEASAMLHPLCLEAVRRFREAARLYHYADDLEGARLAMIAAGERAVDLRDAGLAAHAYLDAAELARLMDDPAAALLPLAAALELIRSSELADNERASLARRLTGLDAFHPAVDSSRTAAARGS